MVEEISQYLAVMIVNRAVEEEGIIAPSDQFLGQFENMFGLQLSRQQLEGAIKILSECMILTKSNDPLAGEFLAIKTTSFQIFKQRVRSDLREYNRIVESAENEHTGINRAEGRSYRYLDKYNKWPALRNYAEFGVAWIAKVVERLQNNEPLESLVSGLPITSSSWTGISDRIGISEKQTIIEKIVSLRSAIEQSDLDEITKKNALARANAIESLLEAPDPPWREIVELLNSRYLCAFLNVTAILQIIFGS
ncbi:hypothetical protein [Parasphingorhabdus sp.]|uniref:hypothetical protein n=1 Tax=Parasphingorhabdus sp. TaxID=2709688 RepID=UPI00359493AD